MMNNIGKTLVMIHITLSLLALTWAAALILQFVDWGWKQPRLDVNERVPSELDKRIAAVNEAVRARNMALAPVKKSQEELFDAMSRYASNHLFYRNELERLRSYTGDAPLVVKDIKFQSGNPVFDQNVAGIDKSIVQYQKVLEGLQGENDKLVKGNRELTAKAQEITNQLNGLDDTGKKAKVGLYDLLENEAQMQARIRFEKDYIQPQWADALERAQEFVERRDRLKETLDRLQGDLGNPGKK